MNSLVVDPAYSLVFTVHVLRQILHALYVQFTSDLWSYKVIHRIVPERIMYFISISMPNLTEPMVIMRSLLKIKEVFEMNAIVCIVKVKPIFKHFPFSCVVRRNLFYMTLHPIPCNFPNIQKNIQCIHVHMKKFPYFC
jgi:hypothetical protein